MAAEAVSGHWRSRYGRLREGYRGLKRALEVTSRALASAGVRLESAAAAVTEESLTADESGSLRLCIVCFAEPFTHAFLPCGHRCVCSRCAANWLKGTFGDRQCIVCRRPAVACTKIYDA